MEETKPERIKSILSGKPDVEDPWDLLDEALMHLKRSRTDKAVGILWRAARVNVAIIPRLALWEELPELGDDFDQYEAWDYMNQNWDRWKDVRVFTALSVFWAHREVRHALGLPLAKKVRLKRPPVRPDLKAVEKDILKVLKGRGANERLARKAAKLCFSMACFIRKIDRERKRMFPELSAELIEIDNFARNVLELYSLDKADEKVESEMLLMFEHLEGIQKMVQEETLEANKYMKKGYSTSYIG